MAALFGRRVRLLREARGWTQEKLGEEVRVHSTRITQIERARGHRPTRELAQALDDTLGADGWLVDLWEHLIKQAFPDWSQEFMDRAGYASFIREYAAHTVPGLLQTEEYASALLRVWPSWTSEEQLAEQLMLRMARQERLRKADAPKLGIVLDEAVIRRPVGGLDVMRRQLARLREAADDPRITIQVLCFDQGEHAAMGGSLTLLTLPGDDPPAAYTEGADYGRLVEDAADVAHYQTTYDQLRALALPPIMSLDLIASAMEDFSRGRVPPPPRIPRMAQEQLQQPSRRQLRGGSRRLPRCRPRP
ncbi:helix-turn-helix domain-containing protein [Uniformispora flossi]|uniref:helix-turn-helix domain-containing protein n=1 Tax=Uniformispora flossi TaxID=3390723 RepID=UPI003C2BD2F5